MAKFKTPPIYPTKGVSETNAQLRDPGYVNEMINLIPDVYKGVYTRPGLTHKTSITNLFSNAQSVFFKSVELNGVEYLLAIETDIKKMWLINIETGTAEATFDSTIVQEYLEDITSYDDIHVSVNRNTIYLTNKTKTVTLKFLQSSVDLTADSAYGFPPKFELYIKYVSDSQGIIEKQATMDLRTFKVDYGNNMAWYNREDGEDTFTTAQLLHDMIHTILTADTLWGDGTSLDLPKIGGKQPLTLSINEDTVTLDGEDGVALSLIYTPDTDYMDQYYTATNNTGTYVPMTTSTSVFHSNLDKMVKVKVTITNQGALNFVFKPRNTGTLISKTLYIQGDQYVKDGSYVIAYADSNWDIYIHPKYMLRSIENPDDYNSYAVTLTYYWQNDTQTISGLTLAKYGDPGDTVIEGTDWDEPTLYWNTCQVTFTGTGDYEGGYTPGTSASAYNYNANQSYAYNTIDQSAIGLYWKDSDVLAQKIYDNFNDTARWTPDLPSDVVLNYTQGDSFFTIQFPHYMEYEININPGMTQLSATYHVSSSQAQANSNEFPLRIYEDGVTNWVAEHITIDATFESTVTSNNYLGAAPLEQLLGSPINATFVYQNRLALLTSQGLVASKTNKFTQFVPEDVANITDADPIDLVFAQPGDTLKYIKPFADSLVIFGLHNQYTLFHNGIFSLSNLRVTPATTYDIIAVEPVSAGSEIYFFTHADASDSSVTYINVKKFVVQPSTQIKTAYDVSKHIPTYITGSLQRAFYIARADLLVLIPEADENTQVYVLKNLYTSQSQIQQAWFKWEFKRALLTGISNADKTQAYFIFPDADDMTNPEYAHVCAMTDFEQEPSAIDNIQDHYDAGTAETFDITIKLPVPTKVFNTDQGNLLTSTIMIKKIYIQALGKSKFDIVLSTGTKAIDEDEDATIQLAVNIPTKSIISGLEATVLKGAGGNRLHILNYSLEGHAYTKRAWHTSNY